MAAEKLMNVHETLEYLVHLDVSSEEDLSDNNDFISRGRLVILTSNDEGDRDTNEDSGDEKEASPKQFEQQSTFSLCYCSS